MGAHLLHQYSCMNDEAKRYYSLGGLAGDRRRDADERHVEALAQAGMLESIRKSAELEQAPHVRSALRRVQGKIGTPRAGLAAPSPRAVLIVTPRLLSSAPCFLSVVRSRLAPPHASRTH